MICLLPKKRHYLSHCVLPVLIELKMKIPHGYFHEIYSRSSLLKNYFVSLSGSGMIHSDFHGIILVLMTNNTNILLVANEGQRIAQVVFGEKEEVVFRKVNCLN